MVVVVVVIMAVVVVMSMTVAVVMIIMFMVVIVMLMLMLIIYYHIKLRCSYPAFLSIGDFDPESIDAQTLNGFCEHFPVCSKIKQCSNSHISAYTGKTFKIQCFHLIHTPLIFFQAHLLQGGLSERQDTLPRIRYLYSLHLFLRRTSLAS